MSLHPSATHALTNVDADAGGNPAPALFLRNLKEH
jgi:hypothetical protein